MILVATFNVKFIRQNVSIGPLSFTVRLYQIGHLSFLSIE
jgi:hypothetical protein